MFYPTEKVGVEGEEMHKEEKCVIFSTGKRRDAT